MNLKHCILRGQSDLCNGLENKEGDHCRFFLKVKMGGFFVNEFTICTTKKYIYIKKQFGLCCSKNL